MICCPLRSRRGVEVPRLPNLRFVILSVKTAFGDADSRKVQQDAQMAGNPEAARMRLALAVYKEHVRDRFELSEGFQNDWGFPKRQQAGDVRHLERGGRIAGSPEHESREKTAQRQSHGPRFFRR